MADIKVNVNELLVWSDNPRHSDETDGQSLSENEVINILINAVGHDFMFNLAKDILDGNLLGNIRPVVVRDGNHLKVYDGNRRIASIKYLLNPNIINDDNTVLRNKIIQLTLETLNFEEKVKNLTTIVVYETTKEDAYRIMDLTHGGVMDGVGTVPWDPFQKDKANYKREQQLVYPTAFELVTKLKLRTKEIGDEYTSFERIFGNSKFKQLFSINDYKSIDDKYLRKIYDLLKKYKKEQKSNQGFSRIFNKASEEAVIFYEWASPQINPEANFIISFSHRNISIYRGQQVSENLLDYDIRKFDGQGIQIDPNKLRTEYISPTGIISRNLDSNLLGMWKFRVTYFETVSENNILVKNLLDPQLTLRRNKIEITHNEAITNLLDYLLVSTNSYNENICDEVVISSNTAVITNGSFISNNSVGEHNVLFKYVDPNNHKEATATLKINVSSLATVLQTNSIEEQKLLVFDGPSSINNYINHMNNSIRKLIGEVNLLDVSEYLYLLSASLRMIVHLLDSEIAINTTGSSGVQLPHKIDNILKSLIDDFTTNHIIKSKENWVDEAALCNAFRALKGDKDWFITALNCGSHTGGLLLTEQSIKSTGKMISKMLVYIAILLY